MVGPSRVQQGTFEPKNPKKYKGSYPIVYRSSWELTVFNKFDQHPNVIEWASESLKIPYRHPFTGKITYYVPDLFVRFVDKFGKTRTELIEVKPMKETLEEYAKSKYDKMMLVLNQAKWKAAYAYCKKAGVTFRVITEAQLFQGYSK